MLAPGWFDGRSDIVPMGGVIGLRRSNAAGLVAQSPGGENRRSTVDHEPLTVYVAPAPPRRADQPPPYWFAAWWNALTE